MCLCLSLAGTTVFNVCTAASFIFYVDQEKMCVRVLYPYVFENAVLETWASGVQVRFSTSTCPLGLVCKMVSFATFHHFHHWYQTACFSLARPLQLLQPSLGSFDKSHECCEPSMTCDSLTWFGKQFLVLDKRSRTGSVNGEQSKLLRGIHCNQDNWCDRLSFATNPSPWSFSCSKQRHTLGVCRCPQQSGHSRPSWMPRCHNSREAILKNRPGIQNCLCDLSWEKSKETVWNSCLFIWFIDLIRSEQLGRLSLPCFQVFCQDDIPGAFHGRPGRSKSAEGNKNSPPRAEPTNTLI